MPITHCQTLRMNMLEELWINDYEKIVRVPNGWVFIITAGDGAITFIPDVLLVETKIHNY